MNEIKSIIIIKLSKNNSPKKIIQYLAIIPILQK